MKRKRDRNYAEMQMRVHVKAKRRKIVEHEKSVEYSALDRSHYTRFEEMNRLRWIRLQLSFKHNHERQRRQLKWEWMYHYVRLRLCFRAPLPTEWNRYTHGGYYGLPKFPR